MSNFCCSNCNAQHQSLVQNGDELLCVLCNTRKNVRIAQTGGSNPFSPGSSPMSGGSYPGSSRLNDDGLDAYMGRTRKRDQSEILADPRMSIEKMLESAHVYAEEDSIPYDLTPSERKKLKIKKELERRRKYYQQYADSIRENSVPFIKSHFQPTEQQMSTIEQSLTKRHLNKNVKHPLEDNNPPTIKPERTHSIWSSAAYEKLAQVVINHGTNTVFNPHVEDEDDENNDAIQFDQPMTGNTPVLMTQNDLDHYLSELGGMDWGSNPASALHLTGPNEPTLMDYTSQQEASDHVGHTDPLPSPINHETQDTGLSTEQKLQQQNWQAPKAPPQSLTKGFNWDDWGSNEENKFSPFDEALRTPAQPKI